jgi:tetratricopeptide (TPR) repeat protein
LGRLYLTDFHNPDRALPLFKKAIRLNPQKPWYWWNYAWALNQLEDCQAVEALRKYKMPCMPKGTCDSHDIEWAQKTSQHMIWKEGCWREHPTLKFLGPIVKWLPGL